MRSACPHIICQKRLEYYSHLGKEYFSLGKRLMKMIEFCIELMEVLYSPLFYTVWNLQWKAHNSRHKSISSVCWWWKIYWRKQTRTRTLYRMEVGKFSSQETLRGFHNSSRASVWDNRCSILNPLRILIFLFEGGGGSIASFVIFFFTPKVHHINVELRVICPSLKIFIYTLNLSENWQASVQ